MTTRREPQTSEGKLRICPFCEATCGLALQVRGREVLAVTGTAILNGLPVEVAPA